MKNFRGLVLLIAIIFMTVGVMISIAEKEQQEEVFSDISTKLIIEDKEIQGYQPPYITDTEIYFPYDFVKDYLCKDINLMEDGKYVSIVLKDKPFVLEDELLTKFVKDNEVVITIPTQETQETVYVSARLLGQLIGRQVQYISNMHAIKIEAFSPMPIKEKKKSFQSNEEKINIAWEYVHRASPDLTQEKKIKALDVLVPTWFHVIDDKGTVINKANKKYVEEAHKKGYQVWGLVSNSFDPNLTSIVLNDKELRKKVIGQLVVYASLYDLDGINIDFENIYYDDKEALVQFVAELKKYIKRQNLVLSIDVTVPSSSKRWSKVYDRKKLGEIVDYVAVMTYDEHWASSPVSGSVASIGWVEKGILRSMEFIPKEKILLGLPFYMRLWKEYKDDKGKLKVESKAISMEEVNEIINEKGIQKVWKEDVAQHYVEYQEEGATYKIWIEDVDSIREKARLVEKYDLAGTAGWRRGFEEEEIWAVLQEEIKNESMFDKLVYED